MALWSLGAALSGMLAGWVLDSGMLSANWRLYGQELTAYDSLLIGFAMLVLLFIVVLGLVPSVMNKHRFMPGG
jgi:MFS family permease